MAPLCRLIFRTIVMTRHCHSTIKTNFFLFCKHDESELGFLFACMGNLRLKWLKIELHVYFHSRYIFTVGLSV